MVFKLNLILAILMVLLAVPSIYDQSFAFEKVAADPEISNAKWKWCARAVKEQFPTHKATGNIKGFTFKLTRAVYFKDQGYLRLEDKHPAPLGPQTIGFRLWTKKIPTNKSILVANGGKGRSPHVEIQFQGSGKVKRFTARHGYGLRLHFGQLKGNKLPGYIILKLPYIQESFIAGYFVARVV